MPFTVTQNETTFRYGDLPLPTFTASGITGTHVTWETTSGALSPTTGTSTTLTPNNETRLISVTAKDRAVDDTVLNTVVKTVQIYSTFPLQPNYGYEIEMDDTTLISLAEDKTAVIRKKAGVKKVWQLQLPLRPLTEYETLRDFWLFHGKVLSFYYYDLAITELKMVRFDSALRITPAGPDSYSMTCVVREV